MNCLDRVLGRYPWVKTDQPGTTQRMVPSYQAYLDAQRSQEARFPTLYLIFTGLLREIGLRD